MSYTDQGYEDREEVIARWLANVERQYDRYGPRRALSLLGQVGARMGRHAKGEKVNQLRTKYETELKKKQLRIDEECNY